MLIVCHNNLNLYMYFHNTFFWKKNCLNYKHLRCLSKTISSTNLNENKTFISKIKTTQPCIKPKIKAKNMNFAGISKHFVPSFKEWDNSIYAYNKQTLKTLPSIDKLVFYLIKYYLNFYDLSVEKTARSMRARKRRIRSSLNKTLVGKPNFKHTSSNIVIMIYYYNRRLKYHLNRINNANTLDNIINRREYKIFIRNIKDKILKIRTLISKYHTLNFKNSNLKTNMFLRDLEKIYLTDITQKFLQKEINSLLLRQIIYIEKSKITKFYLLPLLRLVETIYNKKIMLNFVNIKYIYNSASIISEGIITKLRKRTNTPLRVLRSSLDMFKVPPLNRLALYDDMFNKKVKLQNNNLKDLFNINDKFMIKDTLDNFIDNKPKSNLTYTKLESNDNVIKVIESLKSKFSSGVRFEMAGRLTRRFIAQRSIYKLVYVGNIKNTDSSQRGLSTTLLRGYAKSNVQFKLSKSKRRIGSFGLKTWISSSN